MANCYSSAPSSDDPFFKDPHSLRCLSTSSIGAATDDDDPDRRRPLLPSKPPSPVSVLKDKNHKADTDLYRRYQLGEELDRGEFGVTHRCLDSETGDEAFACKSIYNRKLRSCVDINDVQREVEIMLVSPPDQKNHHQLLQILLLLSPPDRKNQAWIKSVRLLSISKKQNHKASRNNKKERPPTSLHWRRSMSAPSRKPQ